MKTKKERIFYYDLLRAFAIIAVIICHVDHFFGPLTTQTQIIAQMTFHDIGDIGVPIFLMISGALLLNREYPSLPQFLKKRFVRIIYPFIFWIILILGQLYYHGYNSTFIWNVFIGEPSITWYFWTLIGIYLFIPVLNSFIKEYKLKGVEYFLVIWFITMILKTFNSYPLWSYFNLDMFASFIGYPVLGYYLANSKSGLNRIKYDKLGIEDKRFTLKLSMILFLHLFSCGIMAVALPFIIIIAIFNVIFNGITKQVFPDPVKKKTSNELSEEYDSLIKD